MNKLLLKKLEKLTQFQAVFLILIKSKSFDSPLIARSKELSKAKKILLSEIQEINVNYNEVRLNNWISGRKTTPHVITDYLNSKIICFLVNDADFCKFVKNNLLNKRSSRNEPRL